MYIRHHFQSPDDAGAGAPPAEIEVDLPGGVRAKLPREQAEKVIAGRQTWKNEREELTRKYGALEAEKAAAEQARAKAENDAAHLAAIKAGEIEKAKEIAARGPMERLNKLSSKYRDQAIENKLRAIEGIVPEAIPDIVSQLRQSCQFNLDSETLEVTDAAGRPLTGSDGAAIEADAYLSQFLEKRPYFRRASQAPGSGSSGATKITSEPGVIRRADASRLTPSQAQALAKGQLKIIE